MQVDIGEGVDVGAGVPKADVAQVNVAVQMPVERDQVGGICCFDGTGRPQKIADAPQTHICLLVTVEDLGELLNRSEQQAEVQNEGDQDTRGCRTVGHLTGTDEDHTRQREIGEKRDEREIQRNRPLRTHA